MPLGFLPVIRLKHIGLDGLFMVLLSLLVLVATAGLSLVPVIVYVWRVAKNACCDDTAGRPILIMGSALQNGEAGKLFQQRLERACVIRGDRPLVVLGGQTTDGAITEAAAGKRWLEKNNVPASAIRLEEQSTNSLENLQNAKIQLSQKDNSRLTVISNRFHLARIETLAKALNLHVILCAAEDELNFSILLAGRVLLESLFLHWYYVGNWYAVQTGNKKMLLRIR